MPVVTLTLWSEHDYNGDGVPDVDDSQLRRLAQSVLQLTSRRYRHRRQFRGRWTSRAGDREVYPSAWPVYGLSLGQVAQAITASNVETQMGGVESGGTHMMVVSGAFPRIGR